MGGCVLLPLFFLMLLTIGGQTCVATKDCSIYYSVLSRSFVRCFLGNSPNDNISALVNIQHSNFAFTSRVDFVVLDELVGCEATFGLQFRQTCSFLQCLGLFELLPDTKTSLEHCVPSPRLLSVIGLPGSLLCFPMGLVHFFLYFPTQKRPEIWPSFLPMMVKGFLLHPIMGIIIVFHQLLLWLICHLRQFLLLSYSICVCSVTLNQAYSVFAN
ncbi:hypothetical protein C8R41DRAFT_841686, partial [Lentinula lateritia]